MRPSIGFDRDIKVEWLDAIATEVAGGLSPDKVRAAIHRMLKDVLSSGRPGAALTKTTTVLLRIWSQVPDCARSLRDQILPVFSDLNPEERLTAHWAMCMATYPFFLDVASGLGRLISLQGEVSLATLRRRLAEKWGDRSLLPQATGKVVRSMVNWGVLQNLKRGVYTIGSKSVRPGHTAGVFLIHALLVGAGRRSFPVADLERHPALFPFRDITSLAQLRKAKQFCVHRQGVDMEVVELAAS